MTIPKRIFAQWRASGLSLDNCKAYNREIFRLIDREETIQAIQALESYKKPMRKFDVRGREIPEQEPEGVVL